MVSVLVQGFVETIFGKLDDITVQFSAPQIHAFSTIIGVVILNSLFEELVVSAYLVSRLEPWKGAVFAVNASVAVRLSYHLYQGVQAPFLIVPMGLIFAFYFVRTRKVWPLIAAHGFMNFVFMI